MLVNRLFSIALVLGPLAGWAQVHPDVLHCQGAHSSAERAAIRVEFDYSAAQLLADAIGRPKITEAEARKLLGNRGVAAMVTNTHVYSPASSPDSFVEDMQSFVATHRYPTGDFALDWIYKYRLDIRGLIDALCAKEDVIRRRMTMRLQRYDPLTDGISIKVYFTAGGMSDGFVLERDPEPAFFVALDKASGDPDGVEQNMTHELYHVLQRAAASGVPAARNFMSHLDEQSPVQKLLATTVLEGTANFVADARETEGQGPYVSMWRNRYIRNLGSEKMRENFVLFDDVLSDLEKEKIDWATAYYRGFSGNEDSRLYFVGMEMARALVAVHGVKYFKGLFVQPPARFFRDYLVLCDADPSLVKFSEHTRDVIQHLRDGW